MHSNTVNNCFTLINNTDVTLKRRMWKTALTILFICLFLGHVGCAMILLNNPVMELTEDLSRELLMLCRPDMILVRDFLEKRGLFLILDVNVLINFLGSSITGSIQIYPRIRWFESLLLESNN